MTHINQTRIEQRATGRKLAKSLLELAALADVSADTAAAFWDEIRTGLRATHEPVSATAMTDDEASVFEATLIEFGQYQGLKYGVVDIDYLAWLADKSIKLRRYMQSARAQTRQT